MQEVFGPAAVIRGVILAQPNLWGPMLEVGGGDPEIVNALRQYNDTAIMVGLYESDLGHESSSMFRPWANDFSKVMSPAPNTSPEMFWQEGVLRLSETSLNDWRTFHAEDGVEKLKAALKALDRSRIRILHVEIGGERIYARVPKPPSPYARLILPLTWAYQHPDNPLYPAFFRYSAAETDANYARQDDVLKYLTAEFLPANPGSHFISAAEVKTLTKPAWGFDVPFESLRRSVADKLAAWGDKPEPPTFLKVDDRYLSLAELFEVLTDSLAQKSHTGKFPATIHVGRVFGPVLTAQPRPLPSGDVTADSVARVCATLIDALHDDSWQPIPHNAIPSPVKIDNLSLTPAQFLRLMAEALAAPTPDTKLTVKPIQMFAGRIMTYYSRRPRTDMGATWTYKPAVVELSSAVKPSAVKPIAVK